ncbi:MAG TPA: hypothetical protein VH327_07140 [Gammaproteobacteria bacterium]|jgi:hypothetical protein|nr:hypothetical protein [Gammaproteobacteria bacterium]
MLTGFTLLLALAAFALVRVSLLASGLCWVGVFYVGTMAEKQPRESRLFPLLLLVAAGFFLFNFCTWAWHVI